MEEDGKGKIVWGKARARSRRTVHPKVVRWAAEKYDHTSQWHSPSCPKHFRMVQPKLEFQEDGANAVSHDVKHVDDFPAENVGHDKACQAALIRNPQQSKRKLKAFADFAQNNHHICTHMGFPCGLHHHEVKPKIEPVNQTLVNHCGTSDHLLDQRQNGFEQIQLAAESMDTNQPPVEERTSSEMPTSETSSRIGTTFEASDDQPMKVDHLHPVWLTFTSKRRAVTNAEMREAKKAASRYSRTLRGPNSITIMKESQVYKEFFMTLPRVLLLQGAVEFPQPPLTLVDSTGLSWEMQWYASGRHRLGLFPKDWALFAVHHFLEEGDACVFEATDIEALIILVRIFRVVAIPDNLDSNSIYTHYFVK